MALLAVASTITVVQRFVYVHQHRRPGGAPEPRVRDGRAARRWTLSRKDIEVPEQDRPADRAGEREARRALRGARRGGDDVHRRRGEHPRGAAPSRSARSPRWAPSGWASAPRGARRSSGSSSRWPRWRTWSSAPGIRSRTTPTPPRVKAGVLDRHEHLEPIARFPEGAQADAGGLRPELRQAARGQERQERARPSASWPRRCARTSATSRPSTSATGW